MFTQSQVKALETSASALAVKLASFAELTATFEANITRKEDDQRAAFDIHGFLAENFTKEERAAWPVVGSKEKDEAGKLVNNPDIVEYTDLNGTKKTVSFWKNVAVKHPIGEHYQKELAKITDASKPQPAVNEYTGMAKHVREDLRKKYQQRFTTFFGNLRQGVALFDAMDQGNTVPGVSVDYTKVQDRDKDGKPVFEADGKTDRKSVV